MGLKTGEPGVDVVVTTSACPRPAHHIGRVARDGVQRRGGRDRQRWRCTLPDGTFHRFMGSVSRTRVEEAGSSCAACDSKLEAHQGPGAPWRYGYLVEEIAAALVGIGKGDTYTEVAERTRAQAWNGSREYNRGPRTVRNGQLVANWLATYGPVVAAAHRETAWPETLVLDSTEFTHTDSWTGQRSQMFTVMAAYGYAAGQRHGRLWALHAAPTDDGAAWKEFLSSLPGRPAVVIVDEDKGIKAGVRRRWPGASTPAIHQCEHHLYVNARKAMARDGVPDDRGLHELLNIAFTSANAWQMLEAEAQRNPGRGELNRWLADWGPQLQGQLARREAHPEDQPGHWANGAIEDPIRVARQVIGDRAWTLRNRARLNLLLDLVRLRVNKHDSERLFAAAIREHLHTTGGQPTHTADIADQDDSHGNRVYSLRA